MGRNKGFTVIYNSDWMKNDIPDKSINLILADPPYFEVKGDFDFIWNSFDDYLLSVSMWAKECKRVLADNGSLLWWGHAKKIAYSQVIFDKYFNLGNSLVWEKVECQTKAQDYDQARHFAPITERCLFYTNEVEMTGREFIIEEYVAPLNPYSLVMKDNMFKLNISQIEISNLQLSRNGNITGWVHNKLSGVQCPTVEQWELICNLFNITNKYEELKKEYEELRSEYAELRDEYEESRRPFYNTYKLNDVIKHSQESQISSQYDHDTIKPLTLTKKLIQTTTREGDTVLIPFGGSGTDVEACISTKRKYICYEIAKKHYETIKAREKKALLQGELF